MTTPDVTRTLATFACETGFSEVSDDVRRATIRTLLNGVALAVGAADHPAVRIARQAELHLGARPLLSVLGHADPLGTFGAPLVNGIAIHVEDYDDTHLRTVVHPAAPVLPAALGAAEVVDADGHDFMSGLLVGVEVALRVADGICPEHFDLGWHVTGTAGHIGASAAASRVLGLDPARTVVALGLGATQAAGLTAALGTMTKSFHAGKAAADGLEAALLARRGCSGPSAPIEGRRGFARVASPRADFERMLERLGTRWEILDNAIKPYACGIVSHTVIDAAIALRSHVRPDDIEEVDVEVNGVVLDVMGIEDPRSGLESKFSVHHCVAIGLVDGDGSPDQFSDARAVAEDIVAVRKRVRAVIEPDVPKGAARVRIRTARGRELVEEVAHATASAERPMTDKQLAEKVRGLTVPMLGEAGAEALIQRCWTMAAEDGVGSLVAVSRPTRTRG